MRLVRSFFLASLAGICVLAGCEPKKTDAELLMERANAYWEAARLFDLVTMFDMELSAKDGRYLAADAARVLTAPTRVRGYQLSNPQVTGDSGTVELTLTLVMAKYGGKGWDQPPSLDKWTKVDGVWYHGITKEAAEQLAARKKSEATPDSPSTPGTTPGPMRPPVSPAPPQGTDSPPAVIEPENPGT